MVFEFDEKNKKKTAGVVRELVKRKLEDIGSESGSGGESNGARLGRRISRRRVAIHKENVSEFVYVSLMICQCVCVCVSVCIVSR